MNVQKDTETIIKTQTDTPAAGLECPAADSSSELSSSDSSDPEGRDCCGQTAAQRTGSHQVILSDEQVQSFLHNDLTPCADAMVRMYTGRISHIRRPPITREHFMAHLKTITRHKMLVFQGCRKVGLYRQGILHDLSKFSPTEFFVGARYFQGNRSPNNAEREDIGYSRSWLHHKGRNKHHFEYWVDYNLRGKDGESPLIPVKMPGRYVVEMLMDRIAASKIYKGDKYTDASPLQYFNGGRARKFMHPETAALLEELLRMLAERGEDYTFAYIRSMLSK